MIEEIYRLREQAKKNNHPVLRDKSFEILLETIKNKNPKRILEVGTNVGLSGIAMLLTCPSSMLSGIEIDEDIIKEAEQNYKLFGVENRAKIFRGDASEIIPLLTGLYDFIFLDGPKGHYYEYVINLLPLLNKGGILFADNVFFHGFVKGECPRRHTTIKHSMENFLKEITTNKDLKTTVLEIEDGISITEKLK